MSRFKLNNKIFQLGLDAQEMSVFAYMCSLPSIQNTITGETTVHVKQSTIAQNCGIRAVQTIAKVIARLIDKGLVELLKRSVKVNRHKGTYSYAVRQLPTDKEYFFVDRHVFGKLNPRQMMIYLFICKSYSPTLKICWNSYNDMAAQTGMKRETIIQTVRELIEKHFIIRIRCKARENKRVFIDNHYQIIFFIQGRIRKKGNVRLHCDYSRTNRLPLTQGKPTEQFKFSTFNSKCQEVLPLFLSCRGSPSN